MNNYDIGIVGGGPAGYTTALYEAKLGKSVILFEKDKMGGTCLNRGCIPTKAFLHIADLYSELKTANKLGIECENINFDYEKVFAYKENVVDKLRRGLELTMKNAGITVVNSYAEVISENCIKADTTEYNCSEIIVATGSKPREIKGLEFDHEFILNSDDVLNLNRLPKSILIVGSGAIGIEWSRILSAFDVQVTVVELAPRLTPLADWEVSKRIERFFKMKKIKTYLSTSIEKIEDKKVHLSNGEILEPECILSAVGRESVKPDIKINVECIGDACGEIQLAHYAMSQAKELVFDIPFDKDIVPAVIYGTPEIAWVGEVSKSKEDDEKYDKAMIPISALGKSHCDNNIDGFIKILAKDGKIKGASIISKEASSLIQQITIAMQNDLSIEDLKKVCFAHPTYSEGIFEGVMNL